MTDPMKLCPPHLGLRFTLGDMLYGTDICIGYSMVEGECVDCELYVNGKLPEAANPDKLRYATN